MARRCVVCLRPAAVTRRRQDRSRARRWTTRNVTFALLLLGAVLARASATAAAAVPTNRSESALAYPWPIKPFDRPHPIRGNFGDPRTIFSSLAGEAEPGSTLGALSFHNGVDIAAPGGTLVYPVVSGIAALRSRHEVIVHTFDRRTFQYWHISPLVRDGEHVRAERTVLGYVQAEAGHVHLTEIRGTQVQNPLAPGHLTPYHHATPPVIRAILLRAGNGDPLDPDRPAEGLRLAADVFDRPALPVPGPWRGLPVAPALVAWRLTTLSGQTIVPETTVADFRRSEPPNRRFWQVYAPGTYQNFPVFGRRYLFGRAGSYLFNLTPSPLGARLLSPGVDVVTVTASDVDGHASSRSERIDVRAFRSGVERELEVQADASLRPSR